MVSPIPGHAFFEQPQFECLLGDNLLQVLRLAPELLDLIGRFVSQVLKRHTDGLLHFLSSFFTALCCSMAFFSAMAVLGGGSLS